MELSGLKKRMIITICILFAVFSLASVIYYRSAECLPFVLGAFLGSAVSIAKVILLARAVDKSLEKDAQTAGNYVRLQHFLRLLLTGAVLLLAALVSFINLWGAAAGVISFQIAMYFLKFSNKTEPPLMQSQPTSAQQPATAEHHGAQQPTITEQQPLDEQQHIEQPTIAEQQLSEEQQHIDHRL